MIGATVTPGRACPDCGGLLDACSHAAKISSSQLHWQLAEQYGPHLRRGAGRPLKNCPPVGNYTKQQIIDMHPGATMTMFEEALDLCEWLPADDPLRKDLRDGQAYVGREYDRIARERRRKKLLSAVPDLPREKYHVIVADPPWQYNDDGTGRRGAAESHYPTTSLDALKAMRSKIDAIAADNCVLVMWAVSPLLPDALALLDAWGFEYKSSAIWYKTGRMGMGSIFRIDHEFVLVGVRGKGVEVADRGVRSVIDAPVGTHSEKPVAFYQIIERLYPDAKKIELFARARWDGWDAWGAEAPGDAGEAA